MQVTRTPDSRWLVVSPGQRAALWAEAQVGKARAEAEDAALFCDWAPHGYGDWLGYWSGYCTRFVWAAWYRADVDFVHANSATELFWHFRTWVTPCPAPAGAIVFWPDRAQAGHVAIADGAGGAFTTMGGFGEELPVDHIAIHEMGRAAGWVIP